MCDLYVSEDVTHLLFECDSESDARDEFWRNLSVVSPVELYKQMERMCLIELTEFLLAGFRCIYTPEWENMYTIVCLYINSVYNRRRNSIL